MWNGATEFTTALQTNGELFPSLTWEWNEKALEDGNDLLSEIWGLHFGGDTARATKNRKLIHKM